MQTSNPFTKKSNRQIKSNCRPISLFPICGKILEKIIFDQVYSFLNVNKVISKNQSGFRPGDSTIYQLISITSNIFDSFEKYDETRALFLDISIAFDKVWHDGLIFKLKCNGISVILLKFFESYLQKQATTRLKWYCIRLEECYRRRPSGIRARTLTFSCLHK